VLRAEESGGYPRLKQESLREGQRRLSSLGATGEMAAARDAVAIDDDYASELCAMGE
jgi:hypothetical protein